MGLGLRGLLKNLLPKKASLGDYYIWLRKYLPCLLGKEGGRGGADDHTSTFCRRGRGKGVFPENRVFWSSSPTFPFLSLFCHLFISSPLSIHANTAPPSARCYHLLNMHGVYNIEPRRIRFRGSPRKSSKVYIILSWVFVKYSLYFVSEIEGV